MTTGGGTMNATNLTIYTTGNSSAAIRSDRGGGTVTVNNGSYTTDGTGSPVIYSTADITVNDAYLESTASQGVVVEGKNSVTLNDVELVADNNKKTTRLLSILIKAILLLISLSISNFLIPSSLLSLASYFDAAHDQAHVPYILTYYLNAQPNPDSP